MSGQRRDSVTTRDRPQRRGGQDTSEQAGFTLLEVMLALAILALGLTMTSESQQMSMRQVSRAKMMTIATLLAREKMIEVEDELFEEGFSEFDEEDKGDFGRDFKRFSYKLNIEKVELPAAADTDGLSQTLTEGAGGEGEGAGGGMAALGGQMIGQYLEMIRSVIEQSIRRVTLDVIWKEGRRERSITVSCYYTDPRKVDAGMAPISLLDGLVQGAKSKQKGSTSGNQSGANPSTPSGANRGKQR